jgi:hypothetical protein
MVNCSVYLNLINSTMERAKLYFTISFAVYPDYRISAPRVSQHFCFIVLLPVQDLAPILKTSVCHGSAAISCRKYRALLYHHLQWLQVFGSCVGIDIHRICPAVHDMFQVWLSSTKLHMLDHPPMHKCNTILFIGEFAWWGESLLH